MMDIAAAKRYERLKITIRILSSVLLLAYAAVWAAGAAHAAATLAMATSSRWLGLALFGAVFFFGFELISLPLNYYSEFRVEHAFHLSNQTVGGWIIHALKEWLVMFVFGAILIGGLYAALWYGGRFWWLWVWAGWLVLSVGLAKLFPVVILPLFYKSEPLDRAALQERFARLAEGTPLTIRGVYRLGLSKDTRKANAMLSGLGSTRRVYLSDTLLDAFTEEEIGVVFAHELGHHIHGHITKGIVLTALMSTLVVAAVAAVLAPYASNDAAVWPPAVCSLPAIVILVTVISYLFLPIGNAIMRRFERQCDAEALARTKDPAAYRSAFVKLGEMNLADPDPARWIEILFHDHPALSKRIAMADAASAGGADEAVGSDSPAR